MNNKFIKVMLVIIAILLVLNLFKGRIFHVSDVMAQESTIASINLHGESNPQITCSSDGKTVYVVTNLRVYRSKDYGKTWKLVARN